MVAMRIAWISRSLVVAGLVGGGCSKHAPPKTPAAGGGDVQAVLVKKIAIGWQAIRAGAHSDVILTVTDETGAATTHAIGSYPGECATLGPRPDFDAISAIRCKQGGTGIELQAVARNGEVIIMRLAADEGVPQDPMAREEVTRVAAPAGAKIEAAP
jgi:hypothetical protein